MRREKRSRERKQSGGIAEEQRVRELSPERVSPGGAIEWGRHSDCPTRYTLLGGTRTRLEGTEGSTDPDGKGWSMGE